MKTVFIGGSRGVRILAEEVRRRIDRIVEQEFPVLIGDAGGADKTVQGYLHRCGYRQVEVFCMDGCCRNNVGDWPLRAVAAPCRRKDFRYYAAKDRLMATEADLGLMIWDGRSAGTLANVGRLSCGGKKVLVYVVPTSKFVAVARETEWERFLAACPADVRQRVVHEINLEEAESADQHEPSLF
jgi:adenine-specific DNA-methyltransferase